MTALDKFIIVYQGLLIAKLIILFLSIVAVIITSSLIILKSRESNEVIVFAGSTGVSILSFIYMVKRLKSAVETKKTECGRIVPLIWAFCAIPLLRETCIASAIATPLIIFLFVIGILNLWRMRFPFKDGWELRV